MIADATASDKPLVRLMRAHCERARKRQKLPISAKQQLDILKHFVFEVSQGEEPTSELLALSIEMVATELVEDDISATVKKNDAARAD
jgi:hypothetical protein